MTASGKRIRVIDETLREGMQFHGLVFTLEQRIKILEFQEILGVDVCQAGYPSALDREAEIVKALADHAQKNDFKIRTAALGRALASDARILIQTGIDDPHFHFHIQRSSDESEFTRTLDSLQTLFSDILTSRPHARISLAMLDMGKTDPGLLTHCLRYFDENQGLSILSLPDTSGIMVPHQIRETISRLAAKRSRLSLAIHCHNDMGMATANTLTGVMAGADFFEASVLGIGERNGIADLYTTALMLKNQGINSHLDLDNFDGFKAYYNYVNKIVQDQTGLNLMGYCCPVFGEAVKTHVAGTHATGNFGTTFDEDFFLNPLCGRGLVKKFLDKNSIPFDSTALESITRRIKFNSMDRGRSLSKQEVVQIVNKNHLQNPS